MTTGKRSMSCKATSWWATTGRARAASSASHPPMPAGRPACTTVRSHPEAGAFFTRSTTTMLKTGNEHLQSLRDGRVVYIGSEKVDDVTTHPAFRNAARSIAAIYDMKAADNPEFYQKQNIPTPTLRVVREDDAGVVISGMKMLATGAVFANEIWIGNLIPLAPNQLPESITCAIPVNAPGVALWSRKPFERHAPCEFENPLAWRFDETDSMVMCENFKGPWEKVFVHMDAGRAREIYIKTPGHCYGNHQSNVRFHSKMELIVGLASKIAQASGASEVPAVREVLGRFAALEAALGGMIAGQIQDAEDWPEGFKTFNRRYMYAALNWCTESHSQIIDALRELCGGGIFQMPADITVMHDPVLRQQFEAYWQTPQLAAVERMKLYKLAWDLIGSEFAGRHQQYEKFYAGASFIVRNHSFREAPWAQFHKVVDDLMAGYDIPEINNVRKVA